MLNTEIQIRLQPFHKNPCYLFVHLFKVKIGRLMFYIKKLTFARTSVNVSRFNTLEENITKQKSPILSYQAFFAPPLGLEPRTL